ncbi:phosphoglycerate mutase-like protein [Rhizopogon vinicolor AM-OR11-026]|uniref:Phosphoglycerate mutase-like protein n=1 Tax=Rhizopogon vinicolor AM-OR11-026 TaxID=1314800 RepID=A0A1B7NCK9_9AGAM|nr:phosphoglycerate mutase-like protein [Rhizopogon vinicolor AM-OR11-026]
MVNATAGLIGVVLLTRHGDRTEYFQNTSNYISQQAYLTPLGAQQEYELGSFLRSTYLDADSPSFVQNISTEVANIDQLTVRADAGGGNAILDSAYSLLQGLYPPTQKSEITLGNGEKVLSPLGGYQYIPVQSLEYWQAPSLTPWMECNYFLFHLNRVYTSSGFQNISAAAQPFLTALKPYLGGISNNFTNMIYDHVNVQYTHNKTYYDTLPATFLEQARHYANWLQQQVFTDATTAQNVAIRTLLPEVMWSLGNMTLPSNKVKIAVQEVDYKPFISLFNVTNATLYDPDISGIANYASVVALELSLDSTGSHHVSMKFKNGSDDSEFRQLKLFGNTTVTLESFIHQLAWTTINSTINWCFSCNQTIERGCSVFNYTDDPFLNPTG